MFSLYRKKRKNPGGHPALSVPADRITTLSSPEDFRRELLELIASSSRRIYITALYLQDDECGREILEALYRRQEQCPQLKITILVDFHRSLRGLMGKVRQCGNNVMYREFALAHPGGRISFLGVPVKSKEMFGVLHLKGFVFDDTVLYSGASINNVYLGRDGKYRLDRYHRIESPALAGAFAAFILANLVSRPAVTDLTREDIPTVKDLSESIGQLKRHLKRAAYQFEDQIRKPGAVALTPLCGLGSGRNRLNRAVLSIMKNTRSEITICTPYFNMPSRIERSVLKMLERGVQITMVVGDKIANDFYIPEDQPFNRVGAVPYLYEGFLRDFCRRNQAYIDSGQLNVMLWKDGTNTYHVKGIYADDDVYLITGNNLNPRAWNLDIENGLLIRDPEHLLLDDLRKERERILSHTRRITNWNELEKFENFPERIKQYMRKIFRLKLHLLIRRII